MVRQSVRASGSRNRAVTRGLSERERDFRLWVLLVQVSDSMHRAREAELWECGITIEQAAIVYVVVSLGHLGLKATPARISRWMLRKRHTVTEILNRMEKEGLIRRTQDLEKKNMIRVSLTAKGKKAYQLSGKGDVVHEILAALSPKERQRLRELLRKVRDKAFEKIGLKHEALFK